MLPFRRREPVCLAAVLTGAAATTWSLAGCANVAAPPGGPPDSLPPVLISVRPDSFAILPEFDERVVFEFDESISERGIEAAVVLYPYQGRPDVDKGSRELKVKPRGGWVADRIYHIRVHPVVQDLFNNRIPRPIGHVFSTGRPIPENAMLGSVFDRLTGTGLAQGRVDMVRLPDTLRYGTTADSAGGFRLGWLPPGEYLAIGYEDRNNNSRADDLDRSDTLRVDLGVEDTLRLEFRVFEHDTVAPVLAEAQPTDSMTVELSFDLYLDPEAPLDTTSVEVFSVAEDAPVPLDRVMHEWAYEAWRDSLAALRAAEDTIGPEGAEPDSAPAGREARIQDLRRAETRRLQTTDTAAAGPTQRLPARRIYVIADAPIPPGETRIRVFDIVGLSGLVGESEIIFEQPPPEEPTPPEDEPPGG